MGRYGQWHRCGWGKSSGSLMETQICRFFVKNCSETIPPVAWQGPFFVFFYFSMSLFKKCIVDFGKNTTHNGENISNNIPIPIKFPQGGWGKPNTWLACQPAGPMFQKKGSPGGPAERFRAALLFEKYGRSAGQPTMYLAPPSILGVYYWYLYIIGCISPIVKTFC